jgi:acetyltransferase-like isoleucine patch superfamily enzyme
MMSSLRVCVYNTTLKDASVMTTTVPASDLTFPAGRDEYVRRFGSERFLRLAWRKFFGTIGRRVFGARLRRFCLRRLGITIESVPEERLPWVGPEVYIDDSFPELVTIKAGAVLGVRCMILCHDDAKRIVSPVVIGRNSYVGAGAIILPGVTIGDGAIVGAGAVVTRDIPPGETRAGVPARTIERPTRLP